MILIKGLYYVNNYIAEGYNNELLQAVLQEYKFTFISNILKKNYKYNDILLKFDEINLI